MAGNENINNNVSHKDSQLNLYLDLIRYNTQEKLGILPYILKKDSGVFLEVGTGGDAIADLLNQIPDNISPLIIASDVDDNILKILPSRHPNLNKYLQYNKRGPSLKLQQLDATNMACFGNNCLDGINASAVVHEIVSYAGGLKGLDQFFTESYRVLKPSGVLVYRDPESVDNKQEIIEVELSSKPMRLFAHIFIPKFFDTTCSQLAQSERKIKHYSDKDVTFVIYKKSEPIQIHLTYENYLKTHSTEIDFSRRYIIKLPRGLCRELARHYLTYLHQCNPLVFVKCLPNIGSDSYCVNFLSHSTHHIFEKFLHAQALQTEKSGINLNTKIHLDSAILENTLPLEYGIAIKFICKQKKAAFWTLLEQYHFEPNLHVTYVNDTTFLLDYRVFGLLYDHLNEIMTEHNGPVNKQDVVHAQWLKREGEENYIYYSDDELITRAAEVTYNSATGYVLCPLSAESNSFVPRLCYEEVLKESMTIFDLKGYPVEIKEGKRIIHFGKISISDAFPIYRSIVAQDRQKYTNLANFIEKLNNPESNHG